jgi:formylglycine-generating enzyme required for sulfatase activity
MGRINGQYDFAGLLRRHIQASLYSYGQLAQLSGVPKRTIVNWIDGTVKHPRHWQSVVRVAAALRQPRAQTDELLVAADLPDLQSLAFNTNDPEDRLLLAQWQSELLSDGAGTSFTLRRYLAALTIELARLPAYFPRQTAFTFAAIYQEIRLRRLDVTMTTSAEPVTHANDGELWSNIRHQTARAVILGQPGMGKTWMLKAEAMRLAEEALAEPAMDQPQVLPLLIRLPELVILLAGQTSLHAIIHAVADLAARLTPSLPEAEVSAALCSFMERFPERVVFLLDGLDEVPSRDGLRNIARRVVLVLASATRARMLLASRTLGYTAAPLGRYLGSDVVEFEVMPFTNSEIARVMRAWFHGRLDLHQRLQYAMRRAPALIRQASNPLLLSLICMLNETRGGELTGNRSGLYEPVLRLLLEGRWRSFDMQLPESRVRRKLRLLEVIAWRYATYRQSWWEQLPGDVLEQAIEKLPITQRLWGTWRAEWGMDYEGPLWELSEWDGILIKGFVPNDSTASAVPYAFLHRTFQEFMVARYLLRRYTDEGLAAAEIRQFLAHKAADPEWYMVLLLLVEQLTLSPFPGAKPLLERLSDILLNSVQDRTGQTAIAAVEILLNLNITEVGTEVVRSLRDRLLKMMRNREVNTLMRVHAARLLANLGDPRAAVMELDAIDFVPIPVGSFLMGSNPAVDAESFSEELPQHSCVVGGYAISRYPISNAQYQFFLDDRQDGYDNPAYWPEAIALGQWQDGMVWRRRPIHRADGTVAWEVDWAREPHQGGWPANLANSPIMGISWYEARAFVRWLEKRWRRDGVIAVNARLDLPSEAEWEKAARGTDGCIYPWGNEFDGERLNWYGHMLMAPVPIGSFPNSASPYGVEEMVGNLWEWTRTVYQPYGADYHGGTDFSSAVAPDVNIALRGGAYFSVRTRCRCATRVAALPFGRINATFRIVKYEGQG